MFCLVYSSHIFICEGRKLPPPIQKYTPISSQIQKYNWSPAIQKVQLHPCALSFLCHHHCKKSDIPFIQQII